MDILIIESGVVTLREFGVMSAAERADAIALAQARLDQITANPAGARAAVAVKSETLIPSAVKDEAGQPTGELVDPEIEHRRIVVDNTIAGLKDFIATLSKPETRVTVPMERYVESAIGSALVWPRAYRSRLLAESDHVDLVGWRSTKSADLVSAADAYRTALRDLPKAQPDAATVVWPMKPAGL